MPLILILALMVALLPVSAVLISEELNQRALARWHIRSALRQQQRAIRQRVAAFETTEMRAVAPVYGPQGRPS